MSQATRSLQLTFGTSTSPSISLITPLPLAFSLDFLFSLQDFTISLLTGRTQHAAMSYNFWAWAQGTLDFDEEEKEQSRSVGAQHLLSEAC
jgi:hypothetical protein